MKRISVLFIAMTLIVGMVGCDGGESYALAISSTAGGNVTSPGEGIFTYDEGTVVNLTAEAEEGYRFVNWTGDVNTIADVESAVTAIAMNSSYSITANFVAVYELTISSTTGGSVTAPGEGTFTYDEVTVVNLTAEAKEGYYFVNWTGDVDTIGNTNAPVTIITTNDNYEITANFEQIPPNQFALTTSSISGGSVTTPGEGAFIYDEGTVVSLTAEAEDGYRFVNWTGDVDTIANVEAASTNITMNDSYAITAIFVAMYDLTVSSTTGGNVTTPGEGAFAYDEGTVVNLIAEAEEGRRFDGWTGNVDSIDDIDAATTTVTMLDNYEITANFEYIPMVAAGGYHTVGLKSDGTLVAVGDNREGQCNIDDWTDVVQVAAGWGHTVGIESNGTVIAVGNNPDGRCNVGSWTDITQVSAGGYHTVGLESDGTVVAVGWNGEGQCNIDDWTDIIQVTAGWDHTVGLKSDGTVVAVGNNNYGKCDVGGWTDIIQVTVGLTHTVGLKTNGTVVALGRDYAGCCAVGSWTDIIQVAAGLYHTVGIKSDGSVVAVGDNVYGQCDIDFWTTIIQISAGGGHTVGLNSNGTVVAVGDNDFGQCNVSGGTLD